MSSRIIKVGLLAAYLRELVETDEVMQDVWVEGEVSSFTVAGSGHAYFAIKDESATVDCVMWKQTRMRQSFQPKVGELVVAHGGATIYEKNTRFQIRTDVIYPAGAGILQLQLEQLTQKLEAEGLFDPSRKRPLLPFPARIGVVTSETGAVWHDIQQVLQRRYPLVELVLAPAVMQGDRAPESVVSAIQLLQGANVDVIVVARGGGSAEDLWAFNDERIARAIFASGIVVVSAIGHETDTSLADLVADVRAPTPSAAAEMIAPDIATLSIMVDDLRMRALGAAIATVDDRGRGLARLQHRLALLSPRAQLNAMRVSLDAERHRLGAAARHQVERRGIELELAQSLLHALDPHSLMTRGYARVSLESTGESVRTAAMLKPGDGIR
ncbi:MAG: exodeoxyribonuclease VII large subunit, partial [Chloroflexota bacterium]|nr:exodeoxyribonuclease VII large subunit [Chloroflexota bacterium]